MEKADVIVVGRNKNDGKKVEEEFNSLQAGTATFFDADISKKEDNQKIIDFAIKKFNRVDVVVSNAGIYPEKNLQDLEEKEMNEIIDINLKGTIFLAQAAIPFLKENSRIIVTSSITGPITGMPGFATYGATKSAQLGFIKSLALELAPKKLL